MGLGDILKAHVLGSETKAQVCRACGQLKPLSEYYTDKSNTRTGRRVTCVKCCLARRRELNNRPRVRIEEKRCTKCGQVKKRSEFYAAQTNLDGLRGSCKVCDRPYSVARHRNWDSLPKKKRCFACGKEKGRSDFRRDSYSPDGLMCNCRQCTKLKEACRFACKIGKKKKAERGPETVNDWEQIDSALRTMAESQICVNREMVKCKEILETVKQDYANRLRPVTMRIGEIEKAVGRFVKRQGLPLGERHRRKYRFGWVEYYRRKVTIGLNVEYAEAMLDRP